MKARWLTIDIMHEIKIIYYVVTVTDIVLIIVIFLLLTFRVVLSIRLENDPILDCWCNMFAECAINYDNL